MNAWMNVLFCLRNGSSLANDVTMRSLMTRTLQHPQAALVIVIDSVMMCATCSNRKQHNTYPYNNTHVHVHACMHARCLKNYWKNWNYWKNLRSLKCLKCMKSRRSLKIP